MTMRTGERWDDNAPYGVNGYSFGRGEVVRGTVAREFTFETNDRQCALRGVAEMTDGRVYQFTLLRPEFAREKDGRERVRFAHLSREGYRDAARGLLEFEIVGKRVDPAKVDGYRAQADAL